MAFNKSEFDDRDAAPFNMALDTLEKISNMLKTIANLSSELNDGKSQHLQLKWLKNLHQHCIPLYTDRTPEEWINSIHKILREINKDLKYGNFIKDERIVGKYEVYDPLIEEQLDEVLISILEKLKKERYFMPPRSDARQGWKEF